MVKLTMDELDREARRMGMLVVVFYQTPKDAPAWPILQQALELECKRFNLTFEEAMGCAHVLHDLFMGSDG